MAINLNLLPQDLAVKGGVVKVVNIFDKLIMTALAAFLIFALGLVAFFIASSLELKNLNSSVENLKAQLAALSVTEQRVVLLKDRLAKIKSLGSYTSSDKDVENLIFLLGDLPSNSLLGNVSVEPGKIDFSLGFSDSESLGKFLGGLSENKKYKNVLISSLGFNPVSGHLVSLIFSAK